MIAPALKTNSEKVNLIFIVHNISAYMFECKIWTKNNGWFDVRRMKTALRKIGRSVGFLCSDVEMMRTSIWRKGMLMEDI